MSNGENSWGVTFNRISWLDGVLQSHKNVESVHREKDILFHVRRIRQGDVLSVLCTDEYTFGMLNVRRAFEEFGKVDILFVGGVWNGYTTEAKQQCLENGVGLYNAKEISGGLWRDDFWAYHQKNDKGEPYYEYNNAR